VCPPDLRKFGQIGQSMVRISGLDPTTKIGVLIFRLDTLYSTFLGSEVAGPPNV
jgi:hypothetical protein